MVFYKKARQLKLKEASYLAGIVDGEGTVTLTRRNFWRPRHIALTVSNNELPLLEYIQRITGVGKITKKNNQNSKHALSYTYQVYNRQALDLLRTIVPHLKTYKKSRAKLALQKYLKYTPRNGKYTETLWSKREKFVAQFLSIRPYSTKAL